MFQSKPNPDLSVVGIQPLEGRGKGSQRHSYTREYDAAAKKKGLLAFATALDGPGEHHAERDKPVGER